MTSEVEERPRLVMAGYGWHGSQWVKMKAFKVTSFKLNFIRIVGTSEASHQLAFGEDKNIKLFRVTLRFFMSIQPDFLNI